MTKSTSSKYRTYDEHYSRVGNKLPTEAIKSDSVEADYFKPWMVSMPRNARILDVGCGFGHQLYALHKLGFTNLHGIELSEGSFKVAEEELGNIASLERINAFEFLPKFEETFDVIILNDVLEHISQEDVVGFLQMIFRALKKGGVFSVRVPNMSSLLGSYSMYIDITHVTGFTEYSLMQVLDLAGFSQHKLLKNRPKMFLSRNIPKMLKRILKINIYSANRLIHHLIYALRLQSPRPTAFEYNLEVVTTKA